MKYLSKYKIFESFKDSISTIEEILYDISDRGYITYVDEFKDFIFIGIENHNKMIDLDEISDDLIRLYDYMKEHQELFKRRPEKAMVSIMNRGWQNPGKHCTIGWIQPDKRYVNAYKNLLEMDFNKLSFKWNKNIKKEHS